MVAVEAIETISYYAENVTFNRLLAVHFIA